MMYERESNFCTDLSRSPQEIMDYAAIPPALRPRRAETHARTTVDEYVGHLAKLIPWCLERDYSPLPVSPEVVLEYLTYKRDNRGVRIPMLLANIKAISTWHVTMEQPVPTSRELWQYCRLLRKEHKPVQATPASTQQVIEMVNIARLQHPMRAAHNASLITWCYAGAFRPSETRAARIEDLQFYPQGLRIMIPTSKNNPNKPREVTLTHSYRDAYCPICLLEKWLKRSGITSGHIYRGINRRDIVNPADHAMGHSTVSRTIERYCRRIGMRGKLCAYTMRRGCATTASQRGVAIEDLRDHLRHRHVETTQIYVDRLPLPFERSLTSLVLP